MHVCRWCSNRAANGWPPQGARSERFGNATSDRKGGDEWADQLGAPLDAQFRRQGSGVVTLAEQRNDGFRRPLIVSFPEKIPDKLDDAVLVA